MQLEYLLILRVMVIAVIAAVLFCLLFALWRQNRQIRIEGKGHAMRLAVLQEQIRYASVRAELAERKTQNGWSGMRKFRVDEIIAEADDICSFYLVAHDGKPLPVYDPGQYLTFQLQVPGQSRPVVRCYSLSDTPLMREGYRVTIKRIAAPADQPSVADGVSSGFFHRVLKTGDILDCKAPGGNFYLDMAEHSPIVLIGGGIGITPMLSMLRSVALSGSKRETWLFYGARNAAELVQASHLRELADQHENIKVQFCFSDPAAGDVKEVDYEHAERVSLALLQRVLPSSNYDYFICGPAPMMTSLTAGLAAMGVPKDRVHYESFGPASIKPKLAVAFEGAANIRHKVLFARSGKQLEWQPQHGPLLDFAEANGIALDSGCRAGSCGSCAVAVREGNIEYIDEISTEPEAGSCLACMAIPKGKLVIDA